MKRKRPIRGGASFVLVAAGVVFLAVLVAFAGGCGGGETPTPSADEAGGQDEAQQGSSSATTGSTEEASIGDTVNVGSVQWKVTKAKWSDILLSEHWGNDEGTFAILDVDLSNNSTQDLRLATPFFSLVDNQGREFEPDISMNFFHLWGEQNMFVGKVEPGTTKEGKIIFPIDSDSSGLKLRVGEARFGSNETRDIDLGNLPKLDYRTEDI